MIFQSRTKCGDCPNFDADKNACAFGKGIEEAVTDHLEFADREKIIKLDEPVRNLYIIREGLVKLEVFNASGVIATIRIAGAGQFFGYRSLFSKEPAYFAATAIEKTKICVVPRDAFPGLVARDPIFAMSLIEQLASDLKVADERWLAQFGDEAQFRIVRVLLDLDEKFPQHYWTRKEISQLAGTTPETVFRVLSKFKTQGLVQVSDEGISILQREQLLRAVGS